MATVDRSMLVNVVARLLQRCTESLVGCAGARTRAARAGAVMALARCVTVVLRACGASMLPQAVADDGWLPSSGSGGSLPPASQQEMRLRAQTWCTEAASSCLEALRHPDMLCAGNGMQDREGDVAVALLQALVIPLQAARSLAALRSLLGPVTVILAEYFRAAANRCPPPPSRHVKDAVVILWRDVCDTLLRAAAVDDISPSLRELDLLLQVR